MVPYLPRGMAAVDDDGHDWVELARPWRMGPGGVAVAARAMDGLPDREVVSHICGTLERGATALGADADIEHIAALEAAARALCPDAQAEVDVEVEAAVPAEVEVEAAAVEVEAEEVSAEAKVADAAPTDGAGASEPPSDPPESEADRDPPMARRRRRFSG
jgi:hypothetical protein